MANSSRTASAIVYQPDATTQAVQLDASSLAVGDVYDLCALQRSSLLSGVLLKMRIK